MDLRIPGDDAESWRGRYWRGRYRERTPKAAEGPLQALAEFSSAQRMSMRKLPEVRGKPPKRVRGDRA